MARKRMISPEIWQSEDFSKLSPLARLIFIGMFSHADDEGRGRAKATYLKSIICPYDEDLRIADIEKSLDDIAAYMSVVFYSHNENEYYELTNWSLWQKVDKPQKSRIPGCEEHASVIIRRTFGERSGNNQRTVSPNRIKENRKEDKGIEENVYSSEQTAQELPVISLPLNDGSEYPITGNDVTEWSILYPAVDVMQELRNMRGWLSSNPKRRKTKSGIRRFITNWLCREQDKGKSVKPTAGSGNPFVDMLKEGDVL